jgi:hypothetical protein
MLESGSCAPDCWTDERAEELKVLRQLLETVSGLNNGSRFIESVQWCIATADRLRHTDMAGLRLSFLDHIERDCITERKANSSIYLTSVGEWRLNEQV